MRKILFIHDVFPCGGAERVTVDIADYVVKYGYKVYAVACRFGKECSNIISVQLPDKVDLHSMENANFIIDFINTSQIDVCVLPVQGLRHLDYIRISNKAKWIFSLHCTPFWEVNCGLYLKKRKVEKKPLKLLEWFFLTYPKTIWLKKTEKKFVHIYRRIYNQVDAYTVLCDSYKNILIDKLCLSPTDHKVHVLHNSEYIVENVNLNKKKQLLFVGRLTYIDKRIDRLLDIWGMIYKKVSDWELIIVGDGEEKTALQNKAQDMGLERISFVGHTDNVQAYYRDASVLCLTSSFEGWPLCLTEAQANGVIPIAFNCTAGVKEILSPSGINGFLITPFHKRKYAYTLLKILRDPDKLQRMRKDVILKAKLYSPDRIGEKWLGLFELLCN